MIAFILQGIQKNLTIPEQYYAYILDTEDVGIIENAKVIFDTLVRNSLQHIDIIDFVSFSTDAAIDDILNYTEDCSPFFSLPVEVAKHIIDRHKV